MPWTEISSTDDVQLTEGRRLLVKMADWYTRVAKIDSLKRLMGKGARLYLYTDKDHKLLLFFKLVRGRGWKVHHCAYEGSKPREATKIIAAKILEVMNLLKVTSFFAHVPDGLSDPTIKLFYPLFKSDAWDVEVTSVKDGENWVMKRTKVKP